MRVQEAAKMLGGSIVVYVVMAACAASSGVNPGFSDGGGGGGNEASAAGSSGGGTGAGSGVDGSSGGGIAAGSGTDGSGGGSASDGPGLLDAITDPVRTADADVNQSGSRLKAKYYAGADGSKQFAGLHDSQLNVDCVFTAAADGVIRCLPQSYFAAAMVGSGGPGSQTYYADSNCTQPLAFVSCTEPLLKPAYAVQNVTTGSGCQATTTLTHVYPAGASYAGTVYSNTLSPMTAADGGVTWPCVSAPATYTMLNVFYSVANEVAASSFVQGTIQTDQ